MTASPRWAIFANLPSKRQPVLDAEAFTLLAAEEQHHKAMALNLLSTTRVPEILPARGAVMSLRQVAIGSARGRAFYK